MKYIKTYNESIIDFGSKWSNIFSKEDKDDHIIKSIIDKIGVDSYYPVKKIDSSFQDDKLHVLINTYTLSVGLNNIEFIRKVYVYSNLSRKEEMKKHYTFLLNGKELQSTFEIKCKFKETLDGLIQNTDDFIYDIFLDLDNIGMDISTDEMEERMEEFEVIKDGKIDLISLNSLYDYYNAPFDVSIWREN